MNSRMRKVCRVLFVLSVLVTSGESGAELVEREDTLNVDIQGIKGHNWLVHMAFDYLATRFPGHLADGLNERMLHYGAAFSDYPWLGRPKSITCVDLVQSQKTEPDWPGPDIEREAHDHWISWKEQKMLRAESDPVRQVCYPKGQPIEGVREDLRGKTIFDRCSKTTDHCLELRYPHSRNEKSNLYLRLRIRVPLEDPLIFALDNLSHYPHRGSLRFDGTAFSHYPITREWKVKGDRYATVLYQLAQRFWPGNADPRPQLAGLAKVLPGKVRLDPWTNVSGGAIEAEAPQTCLGGNPFILTKSGECTWPIWVPDIHAGQSLKDNLIKVSPDRSQRAAAIYLGWALHLLHDLAQPYHAHDLSGKRHTESEQLVDQWIAEGRFEHLPVGASSRYKFSDRSVYRPDFSAVLARGDQGGMCNPYSNGREGLLKRLDEVIELARSEFEHYQSHLLPNEEFFEREQRAIATTEFLLDISLKNSVMLIACLDRTVGLRGRIRDIDGAPVSGAKIELLGPNGMVETTVASSPPSGGYVLNFPSFGKTRKLRITHTNYPVYSPKVSLLEDVFEHKLFTLGRLPNRATLRGKVILAVNGEPAATSVCATDHETLERECTESTPDGKYRLPLPLSHGLYTAVASPSAFDQRRATDTFEVETGDVHVDFVLAKRTDPKKHPYQPVDPTQNPDRPRPVLE